MGEGDREDIEMVKEIGMVREKCMWSWWETEIAEGRWRYRDKAMY